LRKSYYYKDQPNSLIINVSSNSNKKNILNTDSAKVFSNGRYYIASNSKTINSENNWELDFPLAADETDHFELIGLKINVNGKILPKVRFQRVKQRWRFVGT